MVLYRVNEKIRTRLKHPFGELLVGPPEKTIPQLAKIVVDEGLPKVIAVGDTVSLGMRRFGMDVSLYIVDRKTMRTDIDEIISGLEEIVVRNPRV